MIRPDPDKIIVPRTHGEILAEPPLSQIHPARLILPPDIATKRTQARQQLFTAATEWATLTHATPLPNNAAEKAWVITGHQVEFYHPGVWAKVLAADAVARRSDAVAFDLLVDHDVIDHIGFDVPVERGNGGWGRTREDIAVNPAALPAESLQAPPLNDFLQWDSRLAEYPAAQSDSMPHYLSALRHALPSEGRRGYVEWMSQARASFEQSFNIQVHHVPATWICRGAAWERFVTAWIHNAPAWTEVYNRHLAAYRERQGIKSPQHPMPDLHRDPARGIFELPFWITRPSQPRERLLLDASQPQPPIAQLRPRALSFTMFVRLFLADLFIHGIGGALYDQITDAILQELFQTVPPYACVSAAWLLPLGQAYPPEDLSALKWRRHHIEHNPQLAINPFTALRTEVAELITERKHLIENLNASRPQPPARRADPATRHQRRAWFMHLHAINAELHQKDARMLPNLDQQIADADGAMEQNKVLLWREWFFGLHARKSLEQLKAAINGEP